MIFFFLILIILIVLVISNCARFTLRSFACHQCARAASDRMNMFKLQFHENGFAVILECGRKCLLYFIGFFSQDLC